MTRTGSTTVTTLGTSHSHSLAALDTEVARAKAAEAALDLRLKALQPVIPPITGLPPEEPLTLLPLPPVPPLPPLRTPTLIGDRTYQRIGEAGMRHAYSTIQPWSKGAKWLYLYYAGGWLMDGKTFLGARQIGAKDRAQWSVQDPDVLFHEAGSRISAYNVATMAVTTVHDFGRPVSIGNGEGSMGDSGSLAIQDTAGNACMLNTVTGTVGPWFALGRAPDSVKASHDGEWLVAVFESTPRQTWAYRKDGSGAHKLRDYGNHCDTAVSQAGRQVLVTVSPTVDMIDLETGALTRLLDDNAYVEGHVGNGSSGWATLSNYGATAKPGIDQLVQVKLDGSKLVRRFGFAFHRGGYNVYEQTPMGVSSPDGTKVLFASEFGTGSYYPFVASV